MIRIKLLIILIFTWICSYLYSQHKFSISGTITDEKNGEFLIGSTVYVVSLNIGIIANQYGFYSLTLPESDSVILVYSFLGYQPQIKKLKLNKDYSLDIKLIASDYKIGEISVYGERSSQKNIEKARISAIDITIEKIKTIPSIFGESDILKVVQLLPGVQAGNEGTTGFFVRGGNADQNLVQLDEATIYNPNHLFGLFSTFNTRALNNVELIKGGFPAQYGGRLSSILDIKMKEGNKNNFEVQGGLGLISSQLTVEGPIVKQKSSFIISGRRTYIDLIIKPFLPKGNNTSYNFYDINTKINWQLSAKDRIYLSGFLGNDNAFYNEAKGISYGILYNNVTSTLRWNHIYSQRLFSNTSIIYSTYLQNVSTVQDNHFSQTYTGIADITGKTELQYFPAPKQIIRIGALFTSHRFLSLKRSETVPGSNEIPTINVNKIPARYFSEFACYVNNEIRINKTISANLGLRFPGFTSTNATYYRIEPRATLKIGLNPTSSLKAGYTIMNQFLHLIPSSTAALPTNIWIPSTANTKPQYSTQYAVGYFKNFRQNTIETIIELYYKEMKNQVLFREGNKLTVLSNVDSALVYGTGESYGTELYIKKNYGTLTGWISYTLSWSNQQFDDLNFGKPFPFKYDRRHVLSTAATYQFNKTWSLSAIFVYNSGGTYTLPAGRVNSMNAGTIFEGSYFIYEGRNNTRLKPYHRLDISVTRKKEGTIFNKNFYSELIFGIYNVYCRQNPYFVYFFVDPTNNEPKARQVSLLPIIPSITYTFKF
jgi:hypothetical protein